MAKDKLTDYDSTASGNLDVGGISVAEGMLPSGVNNAIRELMSHQADAFGAGTPLYVDQTNNRVGIGNAAPTTALDVTGTVTADGLTVDGASVFNQPASDQSGGAAVKANGTAYGTNKSIHAYMNTTNANRSLIFAENGAGAVFNVDGSGSVGIGTDSPSGLLHLSANTATTSLPSIVFQDTGTTSTRLGSITNNNGDLVLAMTSSLTDLRSSITLLDNRSMIFATSNSNAMTIDSSGNVLVAKAASNVANVGFEAKSDGAHFMTRDSGEPLKINRLTSDGTILAFAKDGSTVGSIGADSGDLYVGTGDTGVRFRDAGDDILPFNPSTGADRNAAIDLGDASSRFKDLWLSGGVYLGGTGSANKLDDYEEANWTPVLTDGTNTANVGAVGRVTKIGRHVTVTCGGYNFNISSFSSGNTITITGLPFSPSASDVGSVYIHIAGTASTANIPVVVYTVNGSGTLIIYKAVSGGVSLSQLLKSDLGNSVSVRFSLSYITN